MIIYIIVFGFSILFTRLAEKNFKINKKKSGIAFSIIAILIPSILAGIRDVSIGTDVGIYVEYLCKTAIKAKSFNEYLLQTSVTDFEIGYNIFNYVISNIFENVHVLMFIIEFIICTNIYRYLYYKRNEISMPLGMFLFFFVFYNVTLNITRQSIAVSIIIYSLKYLEKKDYKKLIFLFILAFLFHRSATFALLMYGIYILINSKKLNYRSKIAIITVISALLVIVNLYFIPIINLAYKINLVPKKYIDYLINNNQLVKINKIGLITRLIFIIIYVFNKNKNKNSLPYFVYLIMELGILSMSTLSDNFIRIGYYLYLPALFVVIPNTYTILKNTKKNKIIFTLFIMCIFIFSWYREFIIANSSETYPYISIFNK